MTVPFWKSPSHPFHILAIMAKKSDPTFTTVYEPGSAGALAFVENEGLQEEIQEYLGLVDKMKNDYDGDEQIINGLTEIQSKLHSLRIMQEEPAVLREKLEELLQVPVAEGKTLHLSSFRKSAKKNKLASEDQYIAQVRKLIKNTQTNITLLLLTNPDDGILQKFLAELGGKGPSDDFRQVKLQMDNLGKSPQLWHYMEVKKAFLTEWLKPYQEYLDQPIQKMTQEEFNAALSKVEELREQKLEESTNLEIVSEFSEFRAYNRTMHPIINGKNSDFWGSDAIRAEFVQLINTVITRFTFNLENRFLLFRTKEGSFTYLIGFSDEAFEQAVSMEDGKLGLYPHLKVFL